MPPLPPCIPARTLCIAASRPIRRRSNSRARPAGGGRHHRAVYGRRLAPFSDDTLVRLLATTSPMSAVPQLLDLAERNAGDHCDNLTLMAMQWENATSV